MLATVFLRNTNGMNMEPIKRTDELDEGNNRYFGRFGIGELTHCSIPFQPVPLYAIEPYVRMREFLPLYTRVAYREANESSSHHGQTVPYTTRTCRLTLRGC